MRTSFIGTDPLLRYRAERFEKHDDNDGTSLIFIGVPPASRFEAAAAALREGKHVFLEWPPTSSVSECNRLVRLAEEGGLEAAVSRPLRTHLELSRRRANVIALDVGDVTDLVAALADVVDLSLALAGSTAVRRVEAKAAYHENRTLKALLVNLRFHSGTFAQALLRRGGTEGVRVYAAGADLEIDRHIRVDAQAIEHETEYAIQEIGSGGPAPVSALDALHTLRVIERIMSVLR